MSLPIPFLETVERLIPRERRFDDPLSTLAFGTDASFYRLIPKLVLRVESEDEVAAILSAAYREQVPVTFRAAGTSLSGQAISDSVLLVLGDNWNGREIRADGAQIRLQPGVIGAQANAWLAPFGRKIGPDPASINACKIGGIVANNASGMCCGTAQNSYHTLAGLRLLLADGTRLDSEDPASVAAFRASHGEAAGTARRTRPRDPRQRRTGREDPPQVPAEEHHRPVAERAGRLRRAAGHPHPPDGRLRGHPRLHQRGDLRHRPGTPAQGLGAAGFPHGGNLLHGGRGAQAPAGLGGGTARSAQPALG